MAATAGTWFKRILLTILALIVLLFVVVLAALMWFRIPQNASGMAAKTVCSARFVAGREASADELMEQEVLPASVALRAITTSINEQDHTVTSKFAWTVSRTASLTTDRGCVLDLPADPSARAYVPAAQRAAAWPDGDSVAPQASWPAGVDGAALQTAVDGAFEGQGDPLKANARGVAVVQDGKLLIARDAQGFVPGTALHGWSMTKTVGGMLAYKKLAEAGIDIQTPVVDAFPAGREPAWVGQWRGDDRKLITIADLFFMRDGLKLDESYDPTGTVVQMLYGEQNMAQWAAETPLDHAPGSYWEYLSATSNILAAVVEAQFADQQSYWTNAQSALFDPIGVTTATLETDTSGTQVASSYLWASATDWARLGELMLNDGKWQGTQVLPAGWLKLASTQAMPDGEGAGYGAQTWLPANPVGGDCKDVAGIPEDTVSMEGHWGQIVAMVPSKKAVVVRLGWTFEKSQFDGCNFVGDVLQTLPDLP